jgi:hypothetical protein
MQNDIKCPNCGHSFPVEDAFFKKAEERIKSEYEHKIKEQANLFNTQKEQLAFEKSQFEQNKARENEIFNQRLTKKLEEEKNAILKNNEEIIAQKLLALETEKKSIKESAYKEYEDKYKALQEEIATKQEENTKLRKLEIEFLKKSRELQEKEAELQYQFEKKMVEKTDQIQTETRIKEQERSEMRIKEFEKQLDDQKKLIEEMKRKAEQGSMQLQGEIYEIALEELLKQAFPFDQLEEVPKGFKGADLIMTVYNNHQKQAGQIIFESKRTKTFTVEWIEKLKEDQRAQGAAIAVLVTEVLPKDLSRFGRKDGVWICTYHEAESLVFILREMLIREAIAKSHEENKGDKMSMLYNYLIGEDFHQRIEAIVEGFSSLKIDMEKEKRAMQKIWKEREKQIEKVITNTIDMYGSIKGIGGAVIQPVKALELPYSDNQEDDED